MAPSQKVLLRWRPVLLTVAPTLVALAVVILALFGDNGLLRRHQLRRQLLLVQNEVQRLQQENLELRHRIEMLQKSPVAVEREAAERLLMAPPGSTVYKFPEPSEGSDGSSQP